MLLLFILIIIIRLPSSSDAAVLFFHKKSEQKSRFRANQQDEAVPPMPGTAWSHFQCDPKLNPYIGIGFACYCPGGWCSNNNQCCSQMCYRKTCY